VGLQPQTTTMKCSYELMQCGDFNQLIVAEGRNMLQQLKKCDFNENLRILNVIVNEILK
jgi:hypothetical protein